MLDEAPSEVVFDFGVSGRRRIQRQRSSSAAAGWRQVNKPRLSQLRRWMTFEERKTSHGVVVLCAVCEGTSGWLCWDQSNLPGWRSGVSCKRKTNKSMCSSLTWAMNPLDGRNHFLSNTRSKSRRDFARRLESLFALSRASQRLAQ